MRKVVRGVGGLFHEAWREFATERRKAPQAGFVDGDLVEAFLDLGPEVGGGQGGGQGGQWPRGDRGDRTSVQPLCMDGVGGWGGVEVGVAARGIGGAGR